MENHPFSRSWYFFLLRKVRVCFLLVHIPWAGAQMNSTASVPYTGQWPCGKGSWVTAENVQKCGTVLHEAASWFYSLLRLEDSELPRLQEHHRAHAQLALATSLYKVGMFLRKKCLVSCCHQTAFCFQLVVALSSHSSPLVWSGY